MKVTFWPEKTASGSGVFVMKTSMGDIEIELFASEAPKTVQNFLDLAEGWCKKSLEIELEWRPGEEKQAGAALLLERDRVAAELGERLEELAQSMEKFKET